MVQGSSEWLTFYATSRSASKLPAAKGNHKYMSRSELLYQLKYGITKDVDANTQLLFDKGHAAELAGRIMAEKIIGEELFPVVMTRHIDGLILAASLDGINFDGDIEFECKLWNEKLAADVRAGTLDPHYTDQLDQQLLVAEAKKTLFMVTDGTEEKTVWMWYETTQEKMDAVVASWKQVEIDLISFSHVEVVIKPQAEAIMQLPAVIINATGGLSVCNLSEITPRFDTFLAGAKTVLVTDVDFVNADETAKFSRTTAKTLKLKAKEVVDQIASVSEAVRTLELYAEKFDGLGLKLEKLVKSEKETRKLAILSEVKTAYYAHIAALEAETHPIKLVIPAPDFAGAMKGLSKLDSVQNAVNVALANGKIEADKVAKDIRGKLAWCKETSEGFGFLFNDLSTIISKPMEDFQLLVTLRIDAHKAAEQEKAFAEQKRVDAEIATKVEAQCVKIQAEEEAKARAKVAEEERARMIAEAAKLPIIPQERVGEIMLDMATRPSNENIERPMPPAKEIIIMLSGRYNISHDTACDWIIAAAKEMTDVNV
jgi:predicted phage-related endonuclease